MSVKNRLLILMFLGLAAWGGWHILHQPAKNKTLQASGTIETTQIEVGSLIGGRIKALYAKEGDFVKPGQVLLSLDAYQLPAQKMALEAQLTQAKALLSQLQNGPRLQEIAQAQAQFSAAAAGANLKQAGARSEDIKAAKAKLEEAEATLNNDKAHYQRFQQLYQQAFISTQELEDTRTRYKASLAQKQATQQQWLALTRGNRPQEIAQAQAQAQAQQAQLGLLKAGTRPEQIEQQQAVIKALQAQLQQLAVTTQETQIKSPCACQIDSLNWRPGQLVAASQAVATLFNLNDLWLRVYVPDERFGQMQVGQPVQVKVDAFEGESFEGKVVQLASRAEFTPRNIQTPEGRRVQVFGVKIALNNASQRLRPGMPADGVFTLESTVASQPAPKKEAYKKEVGHGASSSVN